MLNMRKRPYFTHISLLSYCAHISLISYYYYKLCLSRSRSFLWHHQYSQYTYSKSWLRLTEAPACLVSNWTMQWLRLCALEVYVRACSRACVCLCAQALVSLRVSACRKHNALTDTQYPGVLVGSPLLWCDDAELCWWWGYVPVWPLIARSRSKQKGRTKELKDVMFFSKWP